MLGCQRGVAGVAAGWQGRQEVVWVGPLVVSIARTAATLPASQTQAHGSRTASSQSAARASHPVSAPPAHSLSLTLSLSYTQPQALHPGLPKSSCRGGRRGSGYYRSVRPVRWERSVSCAEQCAGRPAPDPLPPLHHHHLLHHHCCCCCCCCCSSLPPHKSICVLSVLTPQPIF